MSKAAAPGATSVGRHVGTLVGRDVLNRIARFAAAVLLARSLTLEDFGILNAGIAVAGIAVTATTLGLNDLGARQLAAAPQDVFGRGRLAGQVLIARVGTLAALSAMGLGLVALLAPEHLPLAGLTCAIALVMASSADWMLRGLERMKALGNTIAAGGIATLVGAIAIAITTGSAAAGLLVILAGEVVSTALAWRWAGTIPRLRGARRRIRALLVRSWPLALSSVAMYTYYANLDTVLLAALRSPEEAGLYSAPYRVFLALNAISIYTAFSFLPMLTRGVEGDDHAPAFAMLRRGVLYLLAYSALLLAGALLVGGAALELLFGPDFESVGPTFVVLCIAIMWFSVGYPLGYGLIARNQNRRFLAGAASGAIANVALNLALIPPFGVIGSAAATAIAFVVACLVWLQGNGLLGRRALPELLAMAALSAAAVAALAEDALKLPAVAFSLLVAAAIGWWLLRTGPTEQEAA